MNIEEVRIYCLSFPHTEECFPFDENTLVMKVGGKMWAVLPLEKPNMVIVKCAPERAIELREEYPGINAAWHFNKKHWNQIDLSSHIPRHIIEQSLEHSYRLVTSLLPRKVKQQLNIPL